MVLLGAVLSVPDQEGAGFAGGGRWRAQRRAAAGPIFQLFENFK